jgi:Tfp pilus assembly protein PilV
LRPRRQEGLAGALVAVVLVIAAVIALASLALSRVTSTSRAGEQTSVQLASVADAIEQFAAATGRLPCPADPSLPTTNAAWGDEAVPSPNVGACTFPAGTVPWRTVGAKAGEALDSWGWKVSYRVFSGTTALAGSLTQENGATMVKCDTLEPTAGGATAVSGVKGGLCVPDPDPVGDTTLRSTRESAFLLNKGLALNEKSEAGAVVKANSDVAYLLVSHGPTGLGAYTSTGVRSTLPASGDELDNTNPIGPFVIKPFSRGTDSSTPAHFDDRIFYRTLPDLIQRTKLGARNWAESLPAGSTALTFDRPTLEGTDLGAGFTTGAAGSVGRVTVSFTGVVATGVGSGGSDISFGDAGGFPGIGVAGGGSALLQSAVGELISFELSTNTNRKFAATLGDFGTYGGGRYQETAIFAFLQSGTFIDFKIGQGCRIDGGLASFQMDVAGDFDQVIIAAYNALDTVDMSYDVADLSAFLVSDIAACPASATACVTSLTDFGNICTTS